MTTSVKVTTCCSDDKEVLVVIPGGMEVEEHRLQDGESNEYFVYDDRTVSVKEVLK